VVLVGVINEPRGHSLSGEDAVELQSLRHRHTEVALAVDHEHRSPEVCGEAVGTPLLDVAGRGEDVRVPAVAEGIAEGADRPAVDQLRERVFLLRVEARRKDHEHLHRLAAGAREGHLLD
jgi:hypothetical protein